MPALLHEASVIRSPAHGQTLGSRSQTAADQVPNPFSDLLASCEATESGVSDVAPNPNEAAPVEAAASRDLLVTAPEATPKPAHVAEVAPPPANAMLAMVTSLQAASEAQTGDSQRPVQAEPAVVVQILPVPKGELKPKADDETPALPTQTDVSDAAVLPTTAQAVPLPAAVALTPPTLSAAPAVQGAAVTLAIDESVPAAATELKPTAVVNAPVDPSASPEAAVAATTEAPTEKAAAEPAPAGPATPGQKPVAGKTESKPQAELTASAAKARPAKIDASATEDKPPARPAEMPTHLQQRDLQSVDTKTTTAPAPASADAAATAASLPASTLPSVPAAPQAANPSTHQPPVVDALPVAGLAVEIAAKAHSGKNRFEIRLDPPELGRIDVRLEVDHEGQVTSHLRVERAETLDLLRRDAPALERALQQAGLRTSDSGLQFSLRDQAFSHREQHRDTPAVARVVVLDDALAVPETQRHYGRLASLRGGVDIRV